MRRAIRRGDSIEKVLSGTWFDTSEMESQRIPKIHRYFRGQQGRSVKRQLGNCGLSTLHHDEHVQLLMSEYNFVPKVETHSEESSILAPLQWVVEKHRQLFNCGKSVSTVQLFISLNGLFPTTV